VKFVRTRRFWTYPYIVERLSRVSSSLAIAMRRPKVFKLVCAALVTPLLYLGPWLPDRTELTGWFRTRLSSPQSLKSVRDGQLLVVIPAHIKEDVENLQHTIDQVRHGSKYPGRVKVVVVHEAPDAVLDKLSFKWLKLGRVVKGHGGGRGPTQNIGARSETSDAILFCHADTILPKGFDELLFESLSDQSVLLTAFTFGLDEKGSSALNFIVRSANIRSKQWWMPYGDQALALRRDVFERFGGFRDDFKMMEDFDLVHRIRKDALQSSNDKIVILPDIVESSARQADGRRRA